jgi:hypothetical protein
MRYLITALFLLNVTLAVAQQLFPADLTLSWVNADQYEDGSLIQAGDLTSVRIECLRNNATVPIISQTFPVTGEGQPQTETIVGAIPQPGTYTCVGYSIIFDGTESVASAPAEKKYTGRPKPPVNTEMQ